jgi:hypothetical protein
MPLSQTLTVKTAPDGIVRGDCDVSSFGGEFDGVLEQVPNDLLKFRGVGSHMVSVRS